MKRIFYLMLAGVYLNIISCGKKGCTDVNADNYEAEATVDDESCSYTANVVVWLSSSTADTLNAVYPLDVWIGGSSVGTLESAASAYPSEPTTCTADAGTAVYSTPLDYETGTVSITIWDADNIEVGRWTGLAISGGTCNKVQF